MGARKRLEAQGRSLMVNHGVEPVQNWWKPRTFAALPAPQWMKKLLGNSQPVLLALQEKIAALTLQLQSASLFLQLDVQSVNFILANVFHGVCLGIVPRRLARFGRAGFRFAVGRSELHRSPG
jgi:hypothetical protein